MRITRLLLVGYSRLMLANIQQMEWTPQSKMLLLLGSNGSGKSSILDELTPYPAHHSAFSVGGRKEIDITHNGSTYRLKSNYTGGSGKHSFLENDLELNEGGTFKIQCELVMSRFGVDRNIHEIMTGVQTFTGMATSKRREWLSKLSPIDLTYAFDKHKEITSYQRDALGVIRHHVKRMNNENFDLPDDSEVAVLNAEAKHLQEKLDTLYHMRSRVDPNHNPNFDAERELYSILNRSKEILRQTPVLPFGESVRDKDHFTERLSEKQADLRFLTEQVSQISEEIETLRSRQPSADEQLSPEAVAQLVTDRGKTAAEISQLETVISRYKGEFPLVEWDVQGNAIAVLDALQRSWVELIQQFPNNEEGLYNPQAGQQAKEKVVALKNKLNGIEDRHVLLARRLSSLKGCTDVVCPSCDHQFKPGVDLSEVSRLEAEVEVLHTQTPVLEKELKVVEEFVQLYDEYTSFVYRFRQMVSLFPQFQPVWDYCAKHKVMFRNPRRYLPAVMDWLEVQRQHVRYVETQHQLKVMDQKLELAQKIDRDAVGYLVERTTQLETTLQEKEREQRVQQREIAQFREAGRQIQLLDEHLLDMVENITVFFRKVKTHIEYLNQRGYEEETKAIHLQLAAVQRSLEDIRSRERVLKDLEREHKQATEWHADMGLIAKALSPKDGLIGRYLMGFMQEMVKLMNAVIEEIWTYPLEVMPSKVDKDELDYYFPLNVNNHAVIAPDIARGSSSQRDIVNFAFKLMFMKFMGFEDYPLFLDEFGSTFDEQHRENLIPFMNRLMELEQISQVFYISHFSAMHGAFGQAEVFVLDATNITVPKHYNQNVTIA